MLSDEHGFLHPYVDSALCTECGRCTRVCPVLHRPVVNPEPTAIACRAHDDGLRAASSSGGVFSLLALRTLDAGGVVFGAVFGCNLDVVHEGVEVDAGLARLRGSKYVQSSLGDVYAQVKALLDEGRAVLFSGTPCQVSGLRSFLGRESPNLLCVDMVCHGVPSPVVWRHYLRWLETRLGEQATSASFRNKDGGWRGYSVVVGFSNGSEYRSSARQDPFVRAFLGDVCLRPSCYACEFKGLQRSSDVTLADFWGVEHVVPDLDDDRGTSLVLVHGDAGQAALDDVMPLMDVRPVLADEALQYNPSAVRSASRNPKTEAFYRDLEAMPFDKLVRRYTRPSFARRVRGLVGRVVRRALRLRLSE